MQIDLMAGDAIQIGGIVVTFEPKSGRRARLAITTDHGLPIVVIPVRKEGSDAPRTDAGEP
jgi:hypothetical protein